MWDPNNDYLDVDQDKDKSRKPDNFFLIFDAWYQFHAFYIDWIRYG